LAFGKPHEAHVVDSLRTACKKYLSFVAVLDGELVGRLLFTPSVVMDGECELARCRSFLNIRTMGSALIFHGLEALRVEGCPFVIVLGHPEYSPRFGFVPASKYGLRSQYDGVPDGAFMVLSLQQGALEGVNGMALYRSDFDEAM
jgi:putative acetyltransferase